MPETSFVAGWSIGVLLVLVVLAFLAWLVQPMEYDDAGLSRVHPDYGRPDPCCNDTYQPNALHPPLLCDRLDNHKGMHFDTFAKQAWH